MSAIRTALVKRRHAYTGTDIPWDMEVDRTITHVAPDGRRFGWRLFHYLSGGGMRAFGRPAARERLERRRRRFLWCAAGAAALWLVFLFI